VNADLFAPAAGDGSLVAASRWLTDLLAGQIATTIAVLAVAFVGFRMLTGRFSVKAALRVVLGCFVLFGSSVLVQGLMLAARDAGTPMVPAAAAPYQTPPRPTPAAPPSSANPFDPYSTVTPAARPRGS
jgi:type IV secretory pathway VirB2 component (pilin)